MKHRQYVLRRSKEEDTIRVCWLETRRPLNVGARLTLKGESGVWTVVEVGTTELPHAPDQRWRVGGLT